MTALTWFIGGISGLTGVSSMAAFLMHLFNGNPDMALQYFMGLGGSVAIGWMLIVCAQERSPKAQSVPSK